MRFPSWLSSSYFLNLHVLITKIFFASLEQCGKALSPQCALSEFAKKALDEHNKYRKLHGTEPLTWDPALASKAEVAAKKCFFDHTSDEELKPNGENKEQRAGDDVWKGLVIGVLVSPG